MTAKGGLAFGGGSFCGVIGVVKNFIARGEHNGNI